MFTQREREPTPNQADPDPTIPFVDEQLARSDPQDEIKRRHAVLMECLTDERDRQSEERIQAAIDEDHYDHLQWRQEDAALLIERGQAPLVFNQSRQTIDWIAGMQKRMRSDWKIIPREENDAGAADVKQQFVKYTDDVNLTAWHVSRAFKQAALSGLSWLEEGINLEPGEELIFGGSEDWRNVYRDSRNRDFDLKGARYLFRRKVTDLDYAIALLPKCKEHLRNIARSDEITDENDIWYLGERLTGASDLDSFDGLPSTWRDRRAYIGYDYTDKGRRQSVELLEAWYRVPEVVRVFQRGPLAGKVFNPQDPAHQQLQRDRYSMYETPKLRMRVMVATKDQSCWDGPSPFRHGRFNLVPIWAYRRYRDGMVYGAMRGMRDLQEDTNKRASKALWLLSSNRIVMDEGAVDDIEVAREEAARPDGVIVKRPGKELRFEKPMNEVAGNLEMMDRNVQFMRDVGGVTNANLGRGASGQSGVSVERQQDQGSLTVSELFDNLRLARMLQGRLRLSHIEQFVTERKAIRIVGEGAPIKWLTVNDKDPDTGEKINDITASEADFIVAEQDYRESFAKAAMEEMFQLLGQIANYAPQVVMAVLDLAVDSSDIRHKDEWVARIRKLNGQRDPTKEQTPDEAKREFAEQQKAMLQDKMAMEQMRLSLAKLESEIAKLDADAIVRRVEALFSSLQAAQIVATTPMVAPVADTIAQGAGYQDMAGQDPNIPQPAVAQQPQPAAALPADPMQAPAEALPAPPQQLDGVQQGIQTPTGADNGPMA